MKKILLISLIILLGLSILVYASQQTTESVYINKGWNLVIGFTLTPEAISDINQENIKAIYAFIPTTQEYARSFPEPAEIDKLRLIDDDELLTNAWWLYTEESGNIDFLTENIIPLNERQLYSGWNFISLTSEFVGKNMYDLKGDCDLEKAYWWNSEEDETERGTNWKEIPLDPDFKETFNDYMIGTGLIIKVSSNCHLSSGGGTTPPELP